MERLPYLTRGCEVLIGDEWYPVVGYALTHKPNSPTTGSVFTTKPHGKFEPQLGYRLDYSQIEEVRFPESAG
jgi:hypothetical protein